MQTQIDNKDLLIYKIQQCPYDDILKIKIFLAGLEAGKAIKEEEKKQSMS